MIKAKQTNGFNLGVRGWLLTGITLLYMFFFMGLTNDSLNQMVPTFAGAIGVDKAVLYAFATVSTIIGVIAAFAWGAILKLRKGKWVWVVGLLWGAVFAIVWSFANSVPVYVIGYVGVNIGSIAANIVTGIILLIGLICAIVLKVKPIDEDAAKIIEMTTGKKEI